MLIGHLTNNLGALNFLLGKTDEAIGLLKEAFAIALDTGRDNDAARAVSSLAQVHLRTGNVEQAEEQARHALRLLDGSEDYIDEIGSAQLVLGRSLLEQGRLDEAEAAFACRRGELRAARLRQSPRRLPGSRAAISPPGGTTTDLQHTSTARLPKRSRTCGSNHGEGR